jgi:hypothetical protein
VDTSVAACITLCTFCARIEDERINVNKQFSKRERILFQPGTGVRILKIFLPKIWQKMLFFLLTTASFCKNLIVTLFFKKNANFFRRKLAKIAENCDPAPANGNLYLSPANFILTRNFFKNQKM